jgi:hypothetical protein
VGGLSRVTLAKYFSAGVRFRVGSCAKSGSEIIPGWANFRIPRGRMAGEGDAAAGERGGVEVAGGEAFELYLCAVGRGTLHLIQRPRPRLRSRIGAWLASIRLFLSPAQTTA